MGERKETSTTIAVTPIKRDCRSCAIQVLATRLGLCSWCASLVQEVNGDGNTWVSTRPILDGETVRVLRSELVPPPRLLLLE